MSGKHLLFYDGHCGLCDRIVQTVLATDKQGIFVFAPLQGETAKQKLAHLPSELKSEDSLVLIEDYASEHPQYFLLGNGAFRIAWLLGGAWAIIGVLNFLPGFLFNWGYRLVAANRHRLFPADTCRLPDPGQKERFLP